LAILDIAVDEHAQKVLGALVERLIALSLNH
jgi:hypothetical protein